MHACMYVCMYVLNECCTVLTVCLLLKQMRTKQQQMTMGVIPLAYWLGVWLWDMCMFIVPLVGTAFALLLFGPAEV